MTAKKEWAETAEQWRGRNLHRAELWSGMRITFRFPSLGEMIQTGALPETLLELALLEYGDPGASVALIAQAAGQSLDENTDEQQRAGALARAEKLSHDVAALNRELCAAALVAPKLSADDLASPDFPVQDIEMLAGFLNRTVHYDAAGRRVGTEPLDTFRPFPEKHGCAADCPQCEAARRELSTIHER